MFEQVSIIGCGLIGSSVFRALKKNGSVKKVITFDSDKSVSEIIKKENLSDKIVSNPGNYNLTYNEALTIHRSVALTTISSMTLSALITFLPF